MKWIQSQRGRDYQWPEPPAGMGDFNTGEPADTLADAEDAATAELRLLDVSDDVQEFRATDRPPAGRGARA